MDNDKRITSVRDLSTEEVDGYVERVRKLGVSPEAIRELLSQPALKDGERVGRADLLRGVVITASGIVGSLIVSSWNPSVANGLLLLALSGLIFIGIGIRAKEPLWAAKKQAANLRSELEGSDGFLWRFRETLEYRDADGPIEIHESLIASCEASEAGDQGGAYLDLLHYWHWVSMAYGHLSERRG